MIIEKFKHYLNNFNFPNRLRSSNGVNSKFLYFFHVIVGEVYAPAEIFLVLEILFVIFVYYTESKFGRKVESF